ncbi:hypothetical protein SDC9_166961 [bioreactor metagenome]|uniref:Uncharacterized protein n=1 Tax=bioreactor metagenome TaxID=1076179 RepID=A0A645G124_9ZZZZ
MFKQTFEIVTVVIRDIPENGLKVSCTGRLIDGINNLLKIIGNNLIQRSLLF